MENSSLITIFLAGIGAFAALLTVLVVLKTVDLWTLMRQIRDLNIKGIKEEGEEARRIIQERMEEMIEQKLEKTLRKIESAASVQKRSPQSETITKGEKE